MLPHTHAIRASTTAQRLSSQHSLLDHASVFAATCTPISASTSMQPPGMDVLHLFQVAHPQGDLLMQLVTLSYAATLAEQPHLPSPAHADCKAHCTRGVLVWTSCHRPSWQISILASMGAAHALLSVHSILASMAAAHALLSVHSCSRPAASRAPRRQMCRLF